MEGNTEEQDLSPEQMRQYEKVRSRWAIEQISPSAKAVSLCSQILLEHASTESDIEHMLCANLFTNASPAAQETGVALIHDLQFGVKLDYLRLLLKEMGLSKKDRNGRLKAMTDLMQMRNDVAHSIDSSIDVVDESDFLVLHGRRSSGGNTGQAKRVRYAVNEHIQPTLTLVNFNAALLRSEVFGWNEET